MTVIFFSEMQIPEIKQKNRKKLLVFKIIAFESRTTNSHTPEQDNIHWQSMCYETPRRFWCLEQSNLRKFLILKISAFESMTTNSHNLEQDNCHWQSMCYETPLRFNISLNEMFSKSGSLRVMKKYHESALIQILQEFGTL